jgi:hypothetical protein
MESSGIDEASGREMLTTRLSGHDSTVSSAIVFGELRLLAWSMQKQQSRISSMAPTRRAKSKAARSEVREKLPKKLVNHGPGTATRIQSKGTTMSPAARDALGHHSHRER